MTEPYKDFEKIAPLVQEVAAIIYKKYVKYMEYNDLDFPKDELLYFLVILNTTLIDMYFKESELSPQEKIAFIKDLYIDVSNLLNRITSK